jgi:hypothetical protein
LAPIQPVRKSAVSVTANATSTKAEHTLERPHDAWRNALIAFAALHRNAADQSEVTLKFYDNKVTQHGDQPSAGD